MRGRRISIERRRWITGLGRVDHSARLDPVGHPGLPGARALSVGRRVSRMHAGIGFRDRAGATAVHRGIALDRARGLVARFNPDAFHRRENPLTTLPGFADSRARDAQRCIPRRYIYTSRSDTRTRGNAG